MRTAWPVRQASATATAVWSARTPSSAVAAGHTPTLAEALRVGFRYLRRTA